MTNIHCTSLRSYKSYKDEVGILIIVDITKKSEMSSVANDMGLCIIGDMTSYQGEKKLRKTKKVKMKKRLVSKTGKGGKRQGTGLLKL